MQNNTKTPKISLIVSIFNGESYIKRCMDSIYAQSFSDYEIILVNDGSTDNSLELCREYEKNDEKITVVSKENGGLGSARNAGMAVARGEYITFPDVDDWLESDYCEKLYTLAKKADYDVVASGANNYSQDLKLINSVNYECMHFEKKEDCFANIMTFFPTTLLFDVVWNKLYRREFLVKNNLKFSDLRRAQDAYFNLEVFDCLNSIITTDKAYYNYLNNDADKVNRKFPINYIDINIAYYKKLKEIFQAHGIYVGDVKLQYDTSFVETVFATINMYDNPRWGLDKKGQRKYIVDILNRAEIAEFLVDPSIRTNALSQYETIKNKDVKAIFRLHNIEKLREKLRHNRLLIKFYRLFKKQ